MGVSDQRHAPAALYPQEWTPSTYWIGGWVDPRASLDTEVRGKILCREMYISRFFINICYQCTYTKVSTVRGSSLNLNPANNKE
jgi:hypothetical protein